mmetsp:Transcript_23344/g.41301  ORF Transcript_23344/g.41301 Transcript_23344/m.41301 type:complete len:160 (-) Transcript_23344:182-661(-)
MVKGRVVVCEIDDVDLPFAGTSRSWLVVYFLLCTAVLVVSLHTINYVAGYDPLNIALIATDYVSIDLWSFIHTFCFAGLGFLVPDHMGLFFVFGALWEVFEYAACNINFMGVQAIWNERITNTVWDLWFNSIGYFIGELMLASLTNYRRRNRRQKHKKT